MDLAPVLGRVAYHLKLTALSKWDFRVTASENDEGKSPSQWIVMARHGAVLSPFLKDPRWSRLDGEKKPQLWTDDYSNILQAVSWR